ncbi:hypothetical protein B9Z55_006909 [Caenorhabditis nigoni]|uniref:MATH domain-containing protein n=1 Tax=Caenorhabditis nigoni TaxID=1611254 RepID=A0A2G5V726_9PELO|nr:hypothetical protein B9Z55_006909 [Caenorhabditis nigoni]
MGNSGSARMRIPVKEFSMKLVVGSISSMEDDKEYSVTEEHFGVPWKLEVKVSNGSLSFHLSCLMSKNLTWSIETDLAFKVSTGSDSLSSRHERRFHNSDGNSQFECGWNDLMSTELLMSHLRGGNSNETIFEINVLIKSMTGCGKEILRKFDESIKECSDVVLVVKDRKFYLLKYYLALQSAHFKELPYFL